MIVFDPSHDAFTLLIHRCKHFNSTVGCVTVQPVWPAYNLYMTIV